MDGSPILNIINLTTQFITRKGIVTAVDGVDLQIHRGETLGVVGESGCGKTVLALSILRLVPKTQGRIAEGRVLFNRKDILKVPDIAIRRIRGREISIIFQEPMTSLNPVFKVGYQLEEVLRIHRGLKGRSVKKAVLDVLDMVGIPEPRERVNDYPHQLSGGMRQRIMIAMALSCRPKLMIADEPTTALDVTIQAQILDLMNRLKHEIDMSMLLISHDLGVIAEMSGRVAVMYTGRVVELAEVGELYDNPLHPYTIGLFSSMPGKRTSKSLLPSIPGLVPSLFELPPGCHFQNRCPRAKDQCATHMPPWKAVGSGHRVRCWFPENTL